MPFEQGEAIPFGQHGRPASAASPARRVAGYLGSLGSVAIYLRIAILWLLSAIASPVVAADEYARDAVVCVAKGSDPWVEVARGTLAITYDGALTTYRLDAAGKTATWSSELLASGATRAVSPTSLVAVFAPDAMSEALQGRPPYEARLSMRPSGEIGEVFGSVRLALRIGNSCENRTGSDAA